MKHVIVFRSRLRPGVEAEYGEHADKMYELARTMPGMLSARDYAAEDGERVSIIEFDSAENLRRWREHPDHVRAQDRGRLDWYSSYSIHAPRCPSASLRGPAKPDLSIQICIVERSSEFSAPL